MSSQPSPMLLHSESTRLALSAITEMGSGRSKRSLASSSPSTGSRIQSTILMPASMLARSTEELPSSPFCTAALLIA